MLGELQTAECPLWGLNYYYYDWEELLKFLNQWPLVDFFHRLSKSTMVLTSYVYCQILGVSVETEQQVFYDTSMQNVTLSANVFCFPVSLISALRKWDLLCWSALILLWLCVKIKGFLDITEGSSMLIREDANPVSFQDSVFYPCSQSLHTLIITRLADTTKLREQELPSYQRPECATRTCRIICPMWVTTCWLLTCG